MQQQQLASTIRAPQQNALAQSSLAKTQKFASTLPSSSFSSPPAAASVSASPSPLSRVGASALSSGNGHDYLHASFKIGSTHGRIHFGSDERVFHRSDVPDKARAAHEEVQKFLQSDVLSRQPAWNSTTLAGPIVNGSIQPGWVTAAERFDDRYYNQMESQHLIRKAQDRVEAIRRGIDPDEDGANLNPRWNVSSQVDYKPAPMLGSSVGLLPADAPSRPIPYLPAQRKSLIRLQSDMTLRMRAAKAQEAANKELNERLAKEAQYWHESTHVDGRPTHPQLNKHFQPDYEEIGRKVAEEYGQQRLTTFIHTQEMGSTSGGEEENASGSYSPSRRQSRDISVPYSVHHAHRSEGVDPITQASRARRSSSSSAGAAAGTASGQDLIVVESRSAVRQHSTSQWGGPEYVPYSSKLPPAWYRAEARAKQISNSRAQAPCPKFVHTGEYRWEEQGMNQTGLEEFKDGTAASSPSGSYRWSCCGHPFRDSRGCQVFSTDKVKKRIIVARSDDPSSVAAWGLGPTKAFTKATKELNQRLGSLSGTQPATSANGSVVPQAVGMGLSGPGVAIVKRFEHSGRYERIPATAASDDGEGEIMWSCCGATKPDAQGCVAKTVTQEHRWQLSSP